MGDRRSLNGSWRSAGSNGVVPTEYGAEFPVIGLEVNRTPKSRSVLLKPDVTFRSRAVKDPCVAVRIVKLVFVTGFRCWTRYADVSLYGKLVRVIMVVSDP